ncbi:MAG: hypothetical protein RJB62_1638, partial [Pseudomonadota bacterium]
SHITCLDAFILSFCSHDTGTYEEKNGLLSQWRAYSGGGGYRITFDTKELAKTLSKEINEKFFVTLGIRQVVYADGGMEIERIFPELVRTISIYIRSSLLGIPVENEGNGVRDLLEAATTIKHQAFREEQEVRIVALAGGIDLLKENQKMSPGHNFGKVVQIHVRQTKRGTLRYVAVPHKATGMLPITEVLVGPSVDQNSNYENARRLSGGRFRVERSDTPLIVSE